MITFWSRLNQSSYFQSGKFFLSKGALLSPHVWHELEKLSQRFRVYFFLRSWSFTKIREIARAAIAIIQERPSFLLPPKLYIPCTIHNMVMIWHTKWVLYNLVPNNNQLFFCGVIKLHTYETLVLSLCTLVITSVIIFIMCFSEKTANLKFSHFLQSTFSIVWLIKTWKKASKVGYFRKTTEMFSTALTVQSV